MTRSRAAVVALLALVMLAALGGCAPSGPARPRASPAPARPAGDPLRIGISYGDVLPFLSPRRLSAALDDAAAAGATWIRLDLAWNDVQPAPGRYHWTAFDRVLTAARQRHLSLLPMLGYTPAFARPRGCASAKCGPARPAAFAAFAAAAVHRYGRQGIHDWEIWNEPNSGRFWQPAPDPARYAQLVKLTARAIRAQQPGATILLGSLAAGKLTGYGTPALTFLQQLCTLGVNHLVNAIGWHPYSYPELPSSPNVHNPWSQISRDRLSFASILARAGTPGVGVWITEYGAPTGGPGAPASGPQHPKGVFPAWVTPDFQARLAADGVATAEANPRIAAFFWFTDQDTAGPPSQRGNFFGLRRADGQAKPALAALRRAVAALPKAARGS